MTIAELNVLIDELELRPTLQVMDEKLINYCCDHGHCLAKYCIVAPNIAPGESILISYRFARSLLVTALRMAARVEVIGFEKIPQTGGFIAAANHVGRLEALLPYYYIPRDDIIMLVAEKYRQIPLAPWLVKQLDAIWVDRFNADIHALRETLNRLKKGGALMMAPEGTRSPDGKLHEAKMGGSYLAAKAGVPIVPGGVVGTDDSLVKASLKRLHRAKVTVRVGNPFTLPPLPVKNRDEALLQYTDEIMCQIAALLPPEKWGFYANHQRLKELVEAQGGPVSANN